MTRFRDIVGLVPPEANTVADVGYDHGKVIVQLTRTNRHWRIVGVEKQADARERFWRKYGWDDRVRMRVDLIHGNGLAPLRDIDVDVVIIAGLQEKGILEILRESGKILQKCRRLIVSPMNTRGLLRQYLRSLS